MISLYKIAEISTNKLNKRMEVAMKQTSDISKLYTTENKPFDERIIDSCRKQKDNPKGIDESIFIAHPERFFDRLCYMVFGEKRDLKKISLDDYGITKEIADYLFYSGSIGADNEFSNLEIPNSVDDFTNILMCHGLSPIGDSILLLADIGRSFRTSKVLRKPLKVMLADPTWMSSNRSIYKFTSLSEDDIDKGLRIAFHNREKLYSELKIDIDKKGISAYDRENAISRKKLQKICAYYEGLTSAIWGKSLKNNDEINDTEDLYESKNNNEILKVITKPLELIPNFEGIGGFKVPEHIKALSQFPGVLRGIENNIKPHLEILRTIAVLFSTFDAEIFSYFFTQYYAQNEYRGTSLKIAPISESKFDKPFDDLDLYFKSWGEGHTTNDLLADGQKTISSAKKLSAIYLPQYTLGNFKLLPYTPLSLDALKLKSKSHLEILDNILSLESEISLLKINEVILKTPLFERNRLLSDLSSFLLLAHSTLGEQCIKDATEDLNLPDIYIILEKIDPLLRDSYKNEAETFYCDSQLQEIWKTWLSKIQEEKNPNYIPSHLIFYLLQEDEWENEKMKQNLVYLVAISIKVYKLLIL
jgi:hypothetical protein